RRLLAILKEKTGLLPPSLTRSTRRSAKMNSPQLLLRPPEAAATLGVCVRTLRSMTAKGTIPCVYGDRRHGLISVCTSVCTNSVQTEHKADNCCQSDRRRERRR